MGYLFEILLITQTSRAKRKPKFKLCTSAFFKHKFYSNALVKVKLCQVEFQNLRDYADSGI